LRTNSSDIRVFNDVFVKQDYDLSFLKLAPRFIIDGGANVGCSSLFFAQRYPKSLILAVEPEISNFRILFHNVKSTPNIIPIHAALWNRRASLTVENPKDEKWAFRVIETRGKESSKIKGVTIMDLMAIARMEYIDILKLDIEGAERELFESNYETWLDKVSVIIIELHDPFRKGCSDSVNRATSQYKYRRLDRRENVILIRDKSQVAFAHGNPNGL
jgi:FkbM family methyltransferase